MLDTTTGKKLPDDSPIMLVVNQIWDNETTYQERKAFIEVTLHNSQSPSDLRLFRALVEKIQQRIEHGN